MYHANPSLGASPKLPGWLKNIAGAVIRGTTVSVPTPNGTVNVDLGNKQSVDQARRILAGTRVGATVSAGSQASPLEQANAAASSIPGGWLTLAGLGMGLYLLAKNRG